MSTANVGGKAPNFTFDCIDKIDLFDILDGKKKDEDKSQNGKVTQILFYNQFCNHCEQAVSDLDNRAGDANYKDDVNCLMVSMEGLFFHSKYNDGIQVAPPPAPHKVLKNLRWERHVSAPGARDLYNVNYVPHMTIIDKDGYILTNGDVTTSSKSKILERAMMLGKDAPDMMLHVAEAVGQAFNPAEGVSKDSKMSMRELMYKDRATVLLFHRTRVPACEEALKRISAFSKDPETSKLPVHFIVVNTQNFETLKELGEVGCKAYAGADQYEKYQVEFFPHFVLISKSGKVVRNYEFFGGEGEDNFEKQIKDLVAVDR